ncbi:MAG TPA: PAS domain S-box protein, partial [Patescibacteria group bacterium]|nr:PAS domain S-box protein [Patescibacteria group bacterium]
MGNKEEQFFAKNLQEDLENLERYIQEYSLFLPLAVYSINPVGVVVDVNQTGKEISGYEETDLIGKSVDFLFSKKKPINDLFQETLKKGEIKNREMELVTKKKKKIPVRVSSAARKDADNNVIGCFLAINDITEIKKFQDKLEDKVKKRTKELEKTKDKLAQTLEETKEAKNKVESEKNKTLAIISNLVDPIIILDQDKKINLLNPKAREVFNFPKSCIGKKVKKKDNFSMENFKEFTKKEYQVVPGEELDSSNPNEEEVEIEHDGESLTYKIITTKVYDSKENYIGTMKIFSDMTREKRINRLKTEFVSIAAHQLRTPLSAIKWAIKMILDG